MNQPPLTIFSDNGVLKGAIMPVKPRQFALYMFPPGPSPVWEQYQTAKREAIEKALPVGNTISHPIIDGVKRTQIDGFVIMQDLSFVWPGSYEVRYQSVNENKIVEEEIVRKVYHLSI